MLPPSHICSSLEPILTSDHVHEEVPFLSTKIRVPDPLPRVGMKEAVVRVPVVIPSANRFVGNALLFILSKNVLPVVTAAAVRP